MSSKSSKEPSGSSSSKNAAARFANFQTNPRFRLPSKRKTKTTIDKRFSHMLKDEEFTATTNVDRYGRKLKSDKKKKELQRLYQLEDKEDFEIEDDEVVKRELELAKTKYDPARTGGFASSESDSDSDTDSESEVGEGEVDIKGSIQRLQDEQANLEIGEITNRVAIVNLDWDHIKAADLFVLFSSIASKASGTVKSIYVYPSEFGKERMQREELEGPPREIFKAARADDDDADGGSEEDSDDELAEKKIKESLIQEGDGEDFDQNALRTYQIDRLRYYYAVMTCSDAATAKDIYDATDGREYLASSNLIDLRFVPDDVTFDDKPRDYCNEIPDGYKPIEFTTDALQHSKVKLTWDMTPDELARKDAISRKFKGNKKELENSNDLNAYLASDTDANSDDQQNEYDVDGELDQPKLTKKELARRKMREALGLTDEPIPKGSKDRPVGDMQITFSSALSENNPKKGDQDETTLERYKRKEKERKNQKREVARARREGRDPAAVVESSDEEVRTGDDLGFDDPFFTAGPSEKPSKSAVRKERQNKTQKSRETETTEATERNGEVELLLQDDNADHLEHFDMNEILKAEKQKKKKKNKWAKKAAAAASPAVGLQEGFKLDVGDERFKAVFDNHEFAIDPSNPKYKATQAMTTLLEEGRNKRKAGRDAGGEGGQPKKVKKARAEGDGELRGLVESVKRNSGSRK
jgi:hypothetical protein